MASRYSTIASSTERSSSYRSRSKDESSCSYTNVKSLPIRPAATPIHGRLSPATAPSSDSSSSISSSEGSRSIFDCGPPNLGAVSPITPPEDLLLSSQSPQADNTIEQETPLPKARRRSRRPPLISAVADPRYRAGKASTSLRPDAANIRRSATPPKLKPLVGAKVAKRSQISSLAASEANRTQALRDHDIFMDSLMMEVDQAESGGSSSLEYSDEDIIGREPMGDQYGPALQAGTTVLEMTGTDSEDAEEQLDSDEEEDDSSGPNRLGFKRYCKSDRDMCFINGKIARALKNGQTPKAPGWTYIFESPTRTGHLKIGSTINMNERERSLKRCEKELIQVLDSDRNAFECHSIVETLVHQELHNKRRILCCACGTKHQEWFEIEKDDALRRLRRWRTWIKVQKPYDKQWRLTPYWKWKVKNLPKTLSDVNWDKWVRPSRLEYYKDYWYEEVGKKHCLVLQTHFERKDERFLLVGFAWVLSMYVFFGGACSLWTCVGLVVI